MSIISVKNLSYKYTQNGRKVVDDVSFVIEKGSYTAIVGSNGSGKSTLARIICGLETPLSGTVEIKPGNTVGIVFQSPKSQLVSGIVSRDTAFGPQNLGLNDGEVELRVIESLNIVDMLDRAKSGTSELSLGQTQKIALSGMIAIQPEVLILDEAVSMLDPDSRGDIYEFLRYWHKCGNTIIHITHDIESVEEADTVIGMERGKVFFYGTSRQFLEKVENIFRLTGNPLPKIDKRILAEKTDKEVSLKLDDVSFSYDGKSGVENISFELYKGSITAMTGPSGAGKSTILELCSGLLQPVEGKIAGCRPVLAQQNCQAALFEAFAADDVAFGPRNKGNSGKALVELVKKSMNDASLPFAEFGERQTFGLSGGEQRRLAIAGILAMENDVILFDEPTAGLDSESRYNVMQMFRKLADEGKTVLFTTHKTDEADFADREIRIEAGKLISDSCAFGGNESGKIAAEAVENAGGSESAVAVEGGKNHTSLEEIAIYEGLGLLNGLRNATVGLSGSRKEKVSVIQKVPVVLRILLFLLLFTVSLCLQPVYLCGIMFAVTVVYGILCGFSMKSLAVSCLKILPFLLFFTFFQLVFHAPLPDEVRFTTWKWLTITPSKLWFCLASILRTYSALACICAFFVSTPEYDLIDGLKILLKPLALIKIPVRYFILIVEIIFRFIPLLVDEASSIIKTQLIRGGLGSVKGGMAKIKAIVPLFVPLIIQTIKRSEALADAITMRCFK